MALVRVHNPVVLNPNPKRGTWTESQAAAAKDKAERFVRNVLADDDAGDDFADMGIEEFAERHHKQLVRSNPKPRSGRNMRTITRRKSGNGGNGGNGIRRNQTTSSRVEEDLLDQIDELKAENKELQGQLDEISDVIECTDSDCNAAEHLDTIADILDGDGNDDDD